MKKTIICLLLLISFNAHSDYCEENKRSIEISGGTIQFSSLSECREIYNKVQACRMENVANYELNPLIPRRDCGEILEGYARTSDQ